MTEEIAALVLEKDRAGVARALNLVEDTRREARDQARRLCSALERHSAGGHRVGITGPPGVGKSTLCAALAREARSRGVRVGIVAVDPSSVRSGGALLGDRARMSFDPDDEGLFVRSLATSGELGGLSRAVPAAVTVLAAAYDLVLVETTGVGQTEGDVRHVVDTVVLVVQPGSGDALQFIKAGIMEIPDLFVVNKIDLEHIGTRALSSLKGAMATADSALATEPRPMLAASARDATGIAELFDAIEARRSSMSAEDLVKLRRENALEVALALFTRRFGEDRVEKLGGVAATRALLAAHIAEGALAACDAVGA